MSDWNDIVRKLGELEKAGKIRKETDVLSRIFQLLPEKDIKEYAEKLGISVVQLKSHMVRSGSVLMTAETAPLFKKLFYKAFELFKAENPDLFKRE